MKLKFEFELPDIPALPSLEDLKERFRNDKPVATADENASLADKLDGEDLVGRLGRWAGTLGGATLGGVGAAVMTATTFSLWGVTVIFAVPVMAVAGGVTVGAASAYAVGRAIHGAGKADAVRERWRKLLLDSMGGMFGKQGEPEVVIESPTSIEVDAETAEALKLIQSKVDQGVLQEGLAARMQFLLGAGKMTSGTVIAKLQAVKPPVIEASTPG